MQLIFTFAQFWLLAFGFFRLRLYNPKHNEDNRAMSGEHGGPNQGGTMVDSGPKPDSNEAPLHGDRGIRIELDPEEHARRLEDWKANQRLMEAAAKPVTDSAPSGGDMGTTA